MAFSIPTGNEAELAAEFRNRAQQITAHAATQSDGQMQRGYLDIASAYQRMAEHLERKFGVARAARLPTQAPAAAEISAAITPPAGQSPPSDQPHSTDPDAKP